MRTISLRKFRDTITEITEPTRVVRREPEDGEYRVLGQWTPEPEAVTPTKPEDENEDGAMEGDYLGQD